MNARYTFSCIIHQHPNVSIHQDHHSLCEISALKSYHEVIVFHKNSLYSFMFLAATSLLSGQIFPVEDNQTKENEITCYT